ncbi:hypothetical protein HDU82_008522 [Entophlyctis luteolus]|nr:hypothetical protein HDU82_008522 [Entophlyctis luteolus]
MPKVSKKEAERNQRNLEALLVVPENTSTAADFWTKEEVEAMATMGNRKANGIYAPNSADNLAYQNQKRVSFFSASESEREILKHLRDKYIEQKFMSALGRKDLEAWRQQNPLRSGDSSKLVASKDKLKMLQDMGFTDTEACTVALEKAKGNIDSAVSYLVHRQKGSKQPERIAETPRTRIPSADIPKSSSSKDPPAGLSNSLSFLEGMGFTDRTLNLATLARTGGNVDEAVSILMEAPAAHQPGRSTAETKVARPDIKSEGLFDTFFETPQQQPSGMNHGNIAQLQYQQQNLAYFQTPQVNSPQQFIHGNYQQAVQPMPQQAESLQQHQNYFVQQSQQPNAQMQVAPISLHQQTPQQQFTQPMVPFQNPFNTQQLLPPQNLQTVQTAPSFPYTESNQLYSGNAQVSPPDFKPNYNVTPNYTLTAFPNSSSMHGRFQQQQQQQQRTQQNDPFAGLVTLGTLGQGSSNNQGQFGRQSGQSAQYSLTTSVGQQNGWQALQNPNPEVPRAAWGQSQMMNAQAPSTMQSESQKAYTNI